MRTVASLLLLFLGGCAELLGGDSACTLAGCSSGITIRVAGPAAAYRIEVYPGDATPATPYAATCSSAPVCGVFFPDLVPARARVRVIAPGGQARETAVVFQYVVSQPNGGDCPPTCRMASVEVAAPAAVGP